MDAVGRIIMLAVSNRRRYLRISKYRHMFSIKLPHYCTILCLSLFVMIAYALAASVAYVVTNKMRRVNFQNVTEINKNYQLKLQ